MNLLLLERSELDARGRATLTGARATHLRDVLGVAPGRRLRCGVVDGPLGSATVVALLEAPLRVVVDCRLDAVAPPPGDDVLLLAVPRPKVLRRLVEDATALGFGTIVLMRTWRVDRSHLDSRHVAPDALWPQVRAGLEQAERCHAPRIVFEPRFRPFVEDRLDAIAPAARFVAHPAATTRIERVAVGGPFALAVGPERGFTDFEVELLARHGALPVSLGPHPLRVPTAVVALATALELRRRSTR